MERERVRKDLSPRTETPQQGWLALSPSNVGSGERLAIVVYRPVEGFLHSGYSMASSITYSSYFRGA